jgi:hypothetical protein
MIRSISAQGGREEHVPWACGEQEDAVMYGVEKGCDEMQCSANFPFTTQLCNDGWPFYRRRDNGEHFLKPSRLHPGSSPLSVHQSMDGAT